MLTLPLGINRTNDAHFPTSFTRGDSSVLQPVVARTPEASTLIGKRLSDAVESSVARIGHINITYMAGVKVSARIVAAPTPPAMHTASTGQKPPPLRISGARPAIVVSDAASTCRVDLTTTSRTPSGAPASYSKAWEHSPRNQPTCLTSSYSSIISRISSVVRVVSANDADTGSSSSIWN